jgi:hypothetical protein
VLLPSAPLYWLAISEKPIQCYECARGVADFRLSRCDLSELCSVADILLRDLLSDIESFQDCFTRSRTDSGFGQAARNAHNGVYEAIRVIGDPVSDLDGSIDISFVSEDFRQDFILHSFTLALRGAFQEC